MKHSLIALPITLFAATPAFACSSCGCNLTSDWLSQGLVAQPGTTISLRYDYVPQTRLRSGGNAVDPSAIPLPTNREIEQHTYNHYVTMVVDHAFSPTWALNVQVPFLSRPHSTITEDETNISTSRTRGLGDIRLTARYQGFGGPGITGIQIGLKLPTGKFRQTFRSGPEIGNDVDRGLQPGTGTFDAIIGAYHFGKLGGAFDYIVQAQGQIPLNSRTEYRAGIAGTFSAGVNYTGWTGITPQLQFNFRVAGKDAGLNADHANSGGEQFYAAPGISAAISDHLSAFAIAQLPLYSHVSGYQLAPKYTLSFGLQYKL
jgi:hypothetical protein